MGTHVMAFSQKMMIISVADGLYAMHLNKKPRASLYSSD